MQHPTVPAAVLALARAATGQQAKGQQAKGQQAKGQQAKCGEWDSMAVEFREAKRGPITVH
jgi:hypothetical protein